MAYGIMTNNGKNKTKVIIRQNLLNLFNTETNVLDVFCGDGEMYKKVWKNTNKYIGIDKISFSDERDTVMGDSLKVLETIEMSNFNIFDIDAYGSPYAALEIILRRMSKKQKEIGFCITDGLDMDLKMGKICGDLQKLSGIKRAKIKKANRMHDYFIGKVILKIKECFPDSKEFKIERTKGVSGVKMEYYTVYIKVI